MAPSRALLVAVAALATSALACDALLGLDAYSKVDAAASDAESDTSDAAMDTTTPDASLGGDALDASDGGDAADATEGDAGDTSIIFDGAVDALPPTLSWARWLMPNPDAAIAPGADAMLPNPMSYTGGGDASTTATDDVTHLIWSTATVAASKYGDATMACEQVGMGWHVPTRIQLVSLIDFTQPFGAPTIDPDVFPSTPVDLFWTSSQVPGDAATPVYWVVDFRTGLTQQSPTANYVRCVKEGP